MQIKYMDLINNIQKIVNNILTFNVDAIKKSFQDFKLLQDDINELTEENYCNLIKELSNKNNLFFDAKLEHQSNYEAIGGYIYFPIEFIELYDNEFNLFGRDYIMYKLAYSCYFGNILAMHELSRAFESFNFYEENKILKNRIKNLLSNTQNQSYIVGLVNDYIYEYDKARECFLNVNENNINFGKCINRLAFIEKDKKKKKLLYRKSFELGESNSGIMLAKLMKNKDKKYKLLEKLALEYKNPEGYFEMCKMIRYNNYMNFENINDTLKYAAS